MIQYQNIESLVWPSNTRIAITPSAPNSPHPRTLNVSALSALTGFAEVAASIDSALRALEGCIYHTPRKIEMCESMQQGHAVVTCKFPVARSRKPRETT